MEPCRGLASTCSAGRRPIQASAGFGRMPPASTSSSKMSRKRSRRLRCRVRPPRGLLRAAASANIDGLKYFRVTSGTIAGVKVDISRTGYTGDLGYEIWMPAQDAVRVWDALMEHGKPFDIKAAGMLALDVARIEAGLLLIDVDFFSSKKAMIGVAGVLAVRDGARPARQPRQRAFHRTTGAPIASSVAVTRGRSSGSRSSGPKSSAFTRSSGCRPRSERRHLASPCLSIVGDRQVGKATSTTWSPVLKKMIALATVDRPHFAEGTVLQDRSDC